MSKHKVFAIGFSGGLDSLVTAHMLLKQNPQADFILVHFVINNEQELFTSYAAYKLYEYLKNTFDKSRIYFKYVSFLEVDDYKGVIEHLLRQNDKFNASVVSINAGHSDLPHYYGSRNALYLTYLMSISEAFAKTRNYDPKSVELIPVLGIHIHSTYRQYWDTKGSFILVMKQLARLNDMYTVIPEAPILNYTKRQIVQYVAMHKLPYQLTWTCYTPEIIEQTNDKIIARPCKKCQACIEREEAAKGIIADINDYVFEVVVDDIVTNTDVMNVMQREIKAEMNIERTSQKRKRKNKTNTVEQKDKTDIDIVIETTEFAEIENTNMNTSIT